MEMPLADRSTWLPRILLTNVQSLLLPGSGYNWISEKAQLNLGFTYGDRFFNDKLGIMLSASYQNAPSGSDDVEFVWDTDSKGTICLTDYQIRQYYVTRERQSYSAAFDWDINANHKLFFKGIFNNRNDWENRYRLTLKDLNKDVNKKKEGAVADNKASVRLQTKAGSPTTVMPASSVSVRWISLSVANIFSASYHGLECLLCPCLGRASQRTLPGI